MSLKNKSVVFLSNIVLVFNKSETTKSSASLIECSLKLIKSDCCKEKGSNKNK